MALPLPAELARRTPRIHRSPRLRMSGLMPCRWQHNCRGKLGKSHIIRTAQHLPSIINELGIHQLLPKNRLLKMINQVHIVQAVIAVWLLEGKGELGPLSPLLPANNDFLKLPLVVFLLLQLSHLYLFFVFFVWVRLGLGVAAALNCWMLGDDFFGVGFWIGMDGGE